MFVLVTMVVAMENGGVDAPLYVMCIILAFSPKC